jgi:hypothetical protein
MAKVTPWSIVMKLTLVLAVSFLLLVGLVACSEADITGPGSGTLNVYLTDAPINLDHVTAVNVVVTAMTVFPACDDPSQDCEGQLLDLVPAEGSDEVIVNLLDYRDGAVILMASEEVLEGLYEKIRMEIAAATLVSDDDMDPATPDITEDIFLASDKVDVVVPFTVSAGEETEVILDFDAALSVQVNETGSPKYILRPVINGSQR